MANSIADLNLNKRDSSFMLQKNASSIMRTSQDKDVQLFQPIQPIEIKEYHNLLGQVEDESYATKQQSNQIMSPFVQSNDLKTHENTTTHRDQMTDMTQRRESELLPNFMVLETAGNQIKLPFVYTSSMEMQKIQQIKTTRQLRRNIRTATSATAGRRFGK